MMMMMMMMMSEERFTLTSFGRFAMHEVLSPGLVTLELGLTLSLEVNSVWCIVGH